MTDLKAAIMVAFFKGKKIKIVRTEVKKLRCDEGDDRSRLFKMLRNNVQKKVLRQLLGWEMFLPLLILLESF